MKRVMLMPLVGCCFGGFFGGVGKMIAACVLFPTVAQVSRVEDAGLASSIAIAPESGVADTDLASPLTAAQFSESGVDDADLALPLTATQFSESEVVDTDLASPLTAAQFSEARVASIEDFGIVDLNSNEHPMIEELRDRDIHLANVERLGKVVSLGKDLNKHPRIKELRDLCTSGKISAREHTQKWWAALSHFHAAGYCTLRNDKALGNWLKLDEIVHVNECSSHQRLEYHFLKETLDSMVVSLLDKISRKQDLKLKRSDILRKQSICLDQGCGIWEVTESCLSQGCNRGVDGEHNDLSLKDKDAYKELEIVHKIYLGVLTDFGDAEEILIKKFGTPCKAEF